AWVLMPNHVHALVLPRLPLRVILRWVQGSTVRKSNQLLGRTGQPFWQDESYDHWVRNQMEFDRIVRYIEENPVTAVSADLAMVQRWLGAKAPAPPVLGDKPLGPF